ncbi:hypothetical protein J3459_019229 [Metarhizium acridum]|nr:hypothetical protein J3459_019229 [Metarhizium acridum]
MRRGSSSHRSSRAPCQSIVVVGHSMGAIIASELALHLEILGVVLIGPVNPSAALADVFDARIKLVENATGPKATATQKAFIRALLLAQTAEGYKSLCRTIANAKRPRYEDIKCPLPYHAGSHDKTAPLTGVPGHSEQVRTRSWLLGITTL